MALPAAIRAQLRDTVTIAVKTGTDAYGDDVFADAVSRRARVTYHRGLIQKPGGDEVNTQYRIYAEDLSTITLESRITLPDGTTHDVQRFNRPAWPNGDRHLEIDV